jgi:hypothetical protein
MKEESAAGAGHLTEALRPDPSGQRVGGAYPPVVDDVVGWAVIAASAILLIATAFAVRTRIPAAAVDALLAAAGAGLAVGGLLTVDDVETGSWIVAPIALAALTVVHARAMFAGSGPFRT